MSSAQEIGARVRSKLAGKTQAELASQVQMSADAMSRSLNGERGFSSVELALIAEALGADTHWLITGSEDPLRVRIAARHAFNEQTGERSVPGRAQDDEVLTSVALLYAQAYPGADHSTGSVPADADSMREALGPDFVRTFAERVEAALGIDVVRVQGLSTAYSFTIGGRMVVLLPTNGNWFWSNFALAHELAHLALGHHDADGSGDNNEAEANGFAAELLLPKNAMEAIDWAGISAADCAKFVWQAGVSVDFLSRRLSSLGLGSAAAVRTLDGRRMPGSLRPYLAALGEPLMVTRGPFEVFVDPIDARMEAAAKRRFPQSLLTAHREAIDAGRLGAASLSWMLESSLDEFVEPDADEFCGSVDDLLAEFA
jgi:transcriptional regulator with XRE-family HTH domain